MINYILLPASFCLERRMEVIRNGGVSFYYKFDACVKSMKFNFDSDNYVNLGSSDNAYDAAEQYLNQFEDAVDLLEGVEDGDDNFIVNVGYGPEETFSVDVHFPTHWITIEGSEVRMWCEHNDRYYLMTSLPNTSGGNWCLNLNDHCNHNLVYSKMFDGIGNNDYKNLELLRFYYRVLHEGQRQFWVFDEEQHRFNAISRRGGEPSSGCLLPNYVNSITVEKNELKIVKINDQIPTNKTQFSNMFNYN